MIRYYARTLHGQTGLWAVRLDRPDTRFTDPSYPALYVPVGGEAPGPVCGCAVGRTEEEWGALDEAGDPDDAAGDGLAVLARLDELDGAEGEALPIAEDGEA